MYEMRIVAQMIQLNGGLERLAERPIRIENPPYQRLCIESVGPAPTEGRTLVSVAHYFEQNGDAMADPDIVFEVDPSADAKTGWASGTWRPQSITQHALGIYREAVVRRSGRLLIDWAQVQDLTAFARIWGRNIKAQGFLDVFRSQLAEQGKERNGLKVGQYARNIESGWLGRIDAFERRSGDLLAKMVGVDLMAHTIAGRSLPESLSWDDIQWHALADLKAVESVPARD